MSQLESVKEIAGDGIETANASWSFGGDVPQSFEEHVSKSVPLYAEGHDLVLKLSDFFLGPNSLCYEIGSSSGILLSKVIERHQTKEVHGIGLDVEEAMVDFANSKYKSEKVDYLQADVSEFNFESCDFFMSYYTLQFIRPRVRQNVLNSIYNALNWGGGLILFEKVRGPDARFQDMLTALYIDYKLERGYSPAEIINKTRSLKGVLEPFSTAGNVDLLKRAGFKDIMPVMKYLCFEGYVAVK